MEDLKAGKKDKFIDYAGLFFIGILSLGYLLYSNRFAKLHVYLSFVKAPLFVGEIIFIICFFLFFIKWLRDKKNVSIFAYLFLFYLDFLIIKTFLGYFYWGPLSLRHSVLFLYPLFAIFCYSFYRSDFFKSDNTIFFILGFILILILIPFFSFSFSFYSILTCLVLTLVLINAYPERPMRYCLYALLLLSFPYEGLFHTSRTFIVSNLTAIIYIGFGFLYVLRLKTIYKTILCLILGFLVFLGVTKNSDPAELKSIITFKKTIEQYNETIKLLRIKEPTFLQQKLSIRLYNDGKDTTGIGSYVPIQYDENKKNALNKEKVKQASSIAASGGGIDTAIRHENKEEKSALNKKVERANNIPTSRRSTETIYSNILFRIFIWKEAFEELKIKRPIFGFDFGRPLRCRAIEILRWALGEWSRDGWICMHNSYIDIVYRAGITGILMVIFIFIMLSFSIINSFKNRSLTGILLTGVLINWFIAANFLEILEMPYSAIPLWSLFGLTFAYLFKK